MTEPRRRWYSVRWALAIEVALVLFVAECLVAVHYYRTQVALIRAAVQPPPGVVLDLNPEPIPQPFPESP